MVSLSFRSGAPLEPLRFSPCTLRPPARRSLSESSYPLLLGVRMLAPDQPEIARDFSKLLPPRPSRACFGNASLLFLFLVPRSFPLSQ